jgi:DNA-binding FadR family transcriptional regulator
MPTKQRAAPKQGSAAHAAPDARATPSVGNTQDTLHARDVIDAISALDIRGVIVAHSWFAAIKSETGAPLPLAVMVLADIVHFYKPSEQYDEHSGRLIVHKRFRAHKLQRSASHYARLFGVSKSAAREAIQRLVALGLITSEIVAREVINGAVYANVQYLEPVPDAVAAITVLDAGARQSLAAQRRQREALRKIRTRATDTTPAVDAIGRIDITGNVIPLQWFAQIKTEMGAPHLMAAMLLAELVYWHRAEVVRDPDTFETIGARKRFSGDRYRLQCVAYARHLGVSHDRVTRAAERLEALGLIRRELDRAAGNVLYAEPVASAIERLTFEPDAHDADDDLDSRPAATGQIAANPEENAGNSQTLRTEHAPLRTGRAGLRGGQTPLRSEHAPLRTERAGLRNGRPALTQTTCTTKTSDTTTSKTSTNAAPEDVGRASARANTAAPAATTTAAFGDSGADHKTRNPDCAYPAVLVFKDVTGYWLPNKIWRTVHDAIGERSEDLESWAGVCAARLARGERVMNIEKGLSQWRLTRKEYASPEQYKMLIGADMLMTGGVPEKTISRQSALRAYDALKSRYRIANQVSGDYVPAYVVYSWWINTNRPVDPDDIASCTGVAAHDAQARLLASLNTAPGGKSVIATQLRERGRALDKQRARIVERLVAS